jgi:hypothetical protein
VSVTRVEGFLSFIVPMALLGDDQAAGVRGHLLRHTEFCSLESFPQKDDPNRRVFPEAKLSTTIFVTRNRAPKVAFLARTHPGRLIEDNSPSVRLTLADILRFDPDNAPIVSCSQHDWDIAVRILALPDIRRLKDYVTSFQGEVNETNERARGSFTSRTDAPLALRGANITLYAVREASQGEDIRIKINRFIANRAESSKAFFYKERRVGFQRSAPQNNFRRLIAAPIDPRLFCLDTVSFVPESTTKIPLELILAFLNSTILDWYFRLSSSNSKVNEYQFNSLPVPNVGVRGRPRAGCLVEPEVNRLIELVHEVTTLEMARVLASRSERSGLAPESQVIQNEIDAILFRCYGLSDAEGQYISNRVKEML